MLRLPLTSFDSTEAFAALQKKIFPKSLKTKASIHVKVYYCSAAWKRFILSCTRASIFRLIGPCSGKYLKQSSRKRQVCLESINSIYRWPGFFAVIWFFSSPTLSPVSKLDRRRHIGRLRQRYNLLGGEGGGEGEKAWSSTVHGILSGFAHRPISPLPPSVHSAHISSFNCLTKHSTIASNTALLQLLSYIFAKPLILSYVSYVSFSVNC